MTAPARLPTGGRIDRARPMKFSFDGRAMTGFAGDTLASALIANGVRLVGRSFKYHRPRGILTAGSEEPNALVELRTGARREPNTRATTIELFDGLDAQSQNRWPIARIRPDGDQRPRGPVAVRRLLLQDVHVAGGVVGEAVRAADPPRCRPRACRRREDPDTYEKAHAHCDVLVIGAGPAGLMAALTAGRSGARVILADEDFVLGGRLLAGTA